MSEKTAKRNRRLGIEKPAGAPSPGKPTHMIRIAGKLTTVNRKTARANGDINYPSAPMPKEINYPSTVQTNHQRMQYRKSLRERTAK